MQFSGKTRKDLIHDSDSSRPVSDSPQVVPPSSILSRAFEMIGKYGLAGGSTRISKMIGRHFKEFIYQCNSYYILSFDLQSEDIPFSLPQKDLEICELTLDDVPQTSSMWDALHSEYKLIEYRRRLESGGLCYIAKYKGKIIAANWTAVGVHEEPQLGIRLRMESDVSFGYDGYVHPDFRGRGIIGELIIFGLQQQKQAGFKRRIAMAHVANASILRPCIQKVGHHKDGHVTVKRILGIHFVTWTFDGQCRHTKEIPVSV